MIFGAPVQLVDMAREATRGMSDEEKIAFAIEVCHGVTDLFERPCADRGVKPDWSAWSHALPRCL